MLRAIGDRLNRSVPDLLAGLSIPPSLSQEQLRDFEELMTVSQDFGADSFERRIAAERRAVQLVQRLEDVAVPFMINGLESPDPEVVHRFRRVADATGVLQPLFDRISERCVELGRSLSEYQTQIADEPSIDAERILLQAARLARLSGAVRPREAEQITMFLERDLQCVNQAAPEQLTAVGNALYPWKDEKILAKDATPMILLSSALSRARTLPMNPDNREAMVSLLEGFSRQHPDLFTTFASSLGTRVWQLGLANEPRLQTLWERAGAKLPTN